MISTNERTQKPKHKWDSFVYQTWNLKKYFSSELTLTCLKLSVEALSDDIKTKATEKNVFDYRTYSEVSAFLEPLNHEFSDSKAHIHGVWNDNEEVNLIEME